MTTKPTILLLITQADIGGAQIHVLEILKRLKAHYRFVLATGFEDYLTDEAHKLDIEIRVLQHLKRPINMKRDWLALKECLALLREIKPALLHCHSSKAGVIGRLAAWRLKIPCLFTAHGWAFTPGAPTAQRVYGLLVEFVLCRAIGHVATVSKFDYLLAQRLHAGPDSKRLLIRNGVSSVNTELPKPKQDTTRIISIGRLNAKQKNHGMLVKALAQLDLPYHAKIIGEGAARQMLAAEITAHGLRQRLELIGESRDIKHHLSQADIFVLPSNYEGLPLSILEAMNMGVPVVACDVGGVSEAVLHQKTGLLSARGDAKALATNIKRLAESADLRAQYGNRARRHYARYFTAQRMADQTSSAYQKIILETS